jgi:hypothetical protein
VVNVRPRQQSEDLSDLSHLSDFDENGDPDISLLPTETVPVPPVPIAQSNPTEPPAPESTQVNFPSAPPNSHLLPGKFTDLTIHCLVPDEPNVSSPSERRLNRGWRL